MGDRKAPAPIAEGTVKPEPPPAPPRARMTNEEYSSGQQTLIMAAALLGTVDLDALIAMIDSCHSTAPILDPTLYRRGMDRLGPIREMAVHARRLVHAKNELDAVVVREEKRRG